MNQLFETYPLLLLGLEAGLALFLLLFIVIWTASGSYRKKQKYSAKKNNQKFPRC